MALYYDIPDDLKKLRKDTKRASSDHNTEEWKVGLLVSMHGSLKIVIDGIIGRDYGTSTLLIESILFDPKTPEIWEEQVSRLIGSTESFSHELAAVKDKYKQRTDRPWWKFWG